MYDELKKQIQKIADEFTGVSGISVKINNKTIFSQNADKEFLAASIIKLFIFQALIQKINSGDLSYTDKIKIDSNDIVPGFGILRFLDDIPYMTVKDLAALMITLSDNTAANILIDILGIPYIDDFIKKNNYTNTRFERKMFDGKAKQKGLDNYTTADDTSRVLDNLCKDKTALAILKSQLCNSKIPLYFFRKTEVAHKTGDMTNIEHDAARIFFKNIYVDLIILADGDNKEAILLNNRLGECIYNYFKDS